LLYHKQSEVSIACDMVAVTRDRFCTFHIRALNNIYILLQTNKYTSIKLFYHISLFTNMFRPLLRPSSGCVTQTQTIKKEMHKIYK